MPLTDSTCGMKEVPNGALVWMGPSITFMFCSKEGGEGLLADLAYFVIMYVPMKGRDTINTIRASPLRNAHLQCFK